MRHFLIWLAVLVVLNGIFYFFGWPIHIDIIGSVVLSFLVAGIMYLIDGRRYR